MFINPIILGVAATIGGECVLVVLALAVSLARYTRRSGLTMACIFKAVRSFAAAWNDADAVAKQATGK